MDKKLKPFRSFRTCHEVIPPAVMMCARSLLPPCSVEDFPHERGIDSSDETVRFAWHRFGPLFGSEIRNQRVEAMQSSCCCCHLDEVLVRINGERHYLWRVLKHDGEVLESSLTKTRDKKAR